VTCPEINVGSDHFYLHVIESVRLELENDTLLFLKPFAGFGPQIVDD